MQTPTHKHTHSTDTRISIIVGLCDVRLVCMCVAMYLCELNVPDGLPYGSQVTGIHCPNVWLPHKVFSIRVLGGHLGERVERERQSDGRREGRRDRGRERVLDLL